MAVARFYTVTQTHDQLSKLVRSVADEACLVFITRHGAPAFALLPVEEIDGQTPPDCFLGVRQLACDFSSQLNRVKTVDQFYITLRKKPVAQLLAIEPDDVDDIIMGYEGGLQEAYLDLINQPGGLDALPNTLDLLDELKALRDQTRSSR